MKNLKKSLSLSLALLLTLSCLSGCQGTAPAPSAPEGAPSQPVSSEPAGPAAGEAFTIACNNWGIGAYPLDIIFEALNPMVASSKNITIDLANNEFKADKVISDLQNQLASGVDAALFLGMSQPMFPTAAQLCLNAKVPFAFHANVPAEADRAAISANPYYVGSVITQEYDAGAIIADIALKDGNKTAIISAAAIGDYTHDQRILGFTETFEAGGGEVVYVSHAADPSEGVQKANDFMAAYPDADMVYCCGGDFVAATISAMETQNGIDYKIYGTDVSPDTAQSILDGKVAALNGGQWITGSLAAALLVNRLDGHPILAPDGSAPTFDNMHLVLLDKSNAQGFIDLMTTGGGLLTAEDFDKLLYRSNPEVDYDSFYEFIGSVNELIASRMK